MNHSKVSKNSISVSKWFAGIFLAFAGAIVMLLNGICPASVYAEQSADYDYSLRGYSSATVNTLQFLQSLGYDLYDGEEEYLSSDSRFAVKYVDKIANKYIAAEYDENSNSLEVRPSVYGYTANNGAKVEWQPVSVNGEALSDGAYVSQPADGEDFVTVEYTTQLNIGKDYANAAINAYYNDSKAASQKLVSKKNKYEAAVRDYNTQSAAYDKYLADCNQYEIDSAAYEEYLKQYAEWKRRDDPYQTYLKECEEYERELKAYNEYNPEQANIQYQRQLAEYQQYLYDLDDYNKRYQAYLESMDTPEIKKVKNQIAIVDYMYTEGPLGRTIRNALMGGTVTQVLARKEELKLAGADGKAVDKAGRATSNLRNLITQYEACKTESDKYYFYISCHESLKENFSDLLRTLDYFYRIKMISDFIKKQDRDTQYRILLAQLYEIANALDNGVIYNYESVYGWKDPAAAPMDGTYRIAGETPGKVLEGIVLEDLNDAEPLENGYPVMPVEPERPPEVTEPTPPQRPQYPVAPVEVPPPGPAPKTVPEPRLPAVVEKPVPPVEYEPTEEEKRLADLYDSGDVTERKAFDSDYKLNLTISVKKYFRNAKITTVFFYPSADATQYSCFVESESGSYVEYPSDIPLPEKQRTGYTCTFDYWAYADGSPVDWDNLPETDINVYPVFEETPNEYDVYWVVDGKETAGKCRYGEIPDFGSIPQKPDAGNRKYRFVGWNNPLTPMSDIARRYIAIFEESLLIEWRTPSGSTYTCVWKGDVPEYDGIPEKPHDLLYCYEFTGWDKTLAPAVSDAVYTAEFTQKSIVSVESVPAIVKLSDGVLTADCRSNKQTVFDISSLLWVARSDGAGVEIKCLGFTLDISAGEVYGLAESNVTSFEFTAERVAYAEYIYTLDLYDKDGNPANYNGTVTVTVTGTFSRTNSRMYALSRIYAAGNPETEVRFSFLDNAVKFPMNPTLVYEVRTNYYVNVSQGDGVGISADITECKPSDVVTVNVTSVPAGRYLDRIYVIDANGNEVTVNGFRFNMPSADVTVVPVLGYYQYTIIFKADGKILSRGYYRYGEEVTPPLSPVKAPDGQYSYTFLKWNSEISPVTGDKVYTAVFGSTELPQIESGGLSQIMIILIAGVASVVLLVAVIVILIIVRHKKRKKRQTVDN